MRSDHVSVKLLTVLPDFATCCSVVYKRMSLFFFLVLWLECVCWKTSKFQSAKIKSTSTNLKSESVLFKTVQVPAFHRYRLVNPPPRPDLGKDPSGPCPHQKEPSPTGWRLKKVLSLKVASKRAHTT